MKKLFILLAIVFLSATLIAQEKEREMSDYEKYRAEQEAIEYGTQEEVFYIVENMPKFRGNEAKMFRVWISENVKYPKEAAKEEIEGKVIVSFVVNKYGDVVNVTIEKAVNPYLDSEAIRVVESSPKWKPGKQNGKAVNVQFTFPINFVLDNVAEEPVVVNYYYVQSDFRHSLYFGYSWNYRPYGYPYYNTWYGGYYDYYSYYGAYYPYYGYPYYGYSYYPYYGHNHYYGYNNNYYRNYSNPYYSKTYRSGNVNTAYRGSKNNAVRTSQTRAVQTKSVQARTTQVKSQRNYNPTYSKPRTSGQRVSFNKPTARSRNTYATSTQKAQRSTSVRSQRTTNVRATRTPSSYSRSSAPSSSSSSYSRSSAPSRSSGSVSRSSGSVSRSSSSRR